MMKTLRPQKRRFPRAKEKIPVRLTFSDGKREFLATAYTADISLTGVFFAAEFFLKPGLELNLEFKMPNDDRTIKVRGVIIREVRFQNKASAGSISGFGMRFIHYYADAKTALATSFLTVELGDFIEDYVSRRTKKPTSNNELLRDVIVAWEVSKMNLEGTEAEFISDKLRLDSEGRIRRKTIMPPNKDNEKTKKNTKR
ncbi:MAG: PilZ domain-containing protein [Deltaproteobacteria bacterium]|nr:PilZ domain-containing protein [Deltaproteobacteria bacterium]